MSWKCDEGHTSCHNRTECERRTAIERGSTACYDARYSLDEPLVIQEASNEELRASGCGYERVIGALGEWWNW